jgi:hypothetical protein
MSVDVAGEAVEKEDCLFFLSFCISLAVHKLQKDGPNISEILLAVRAFEAVAIQY